MSDGSSFFHFEFLESRFPSIWVDGGGSLAVEAEGRTTPLVGAVLKSTCSSTLSQEEEAEVPGVEYLTGLNFLSSSFLLAL